MQNNIDRGTTSCSRDPIIEEIHAAREQHARAFNYDIDTIVEDLKRRQEKSGRKTISFPHRRISMGCNEGEA